MKTLATKMRLCRPRAGVLRYAAAIAKFATAKKTNTGVIRIGRLTPSTSATVTQTTNTPEHHIRWIRLYFQPEGDKFAYEVGSFEFTAHGESVDGPNTGPVTTDHCVICSMKINKPGQLLATSYCNIHGLWENSREVKIK